MKLNKYYMDIPGFRLICVAENMIKAREVFKTMAVNQGAPPSICEYRTIVRVPFGKPAGVAK